jgi:hypothetical protein
MCSALNAISVDYLARAYTTWAELEKAKVEAREGCYYDFSASGVDFAAFESVQSAADVNTLRKALGYGRILF